MSKINKIQVDETTYDIEDLSIPSWAKQESKPTYSYSEITNTPNLSTVATSGNYNDLSNKPTIPTNSDFTLNGLSEKSYNNLTDKPTIPDVSNFITKDVNDLTYYELKTATGNNIVMSIDSSTYVLTVSLRNSANTILNTQTVDLPLETMVVGGSYDSTNKKIILTLKNGQTIEFSVADLVSGLQSEITSNNKLSADLVDDTNSTNKFVSASDKTNWNSKVGTTDYATNSTGGVIKSSSNYGVLVNNTGVVYINDVAYSTYSTLGNYYAISKGTLENVITGKGLVSNSIIKNTNSTTAGDVYDVRYINTLIGDIDSALDSINGEVVS